MALLTKSDVITYSKVPKEFPTCNLEDIEDVEWKEFNDILGKEFYVKLESDLVDFDSSVDWDAGTQFANGDVVLFEKSYYIAIAEPEPDMGKDPTLDTGQWRKVTKFTTECLDLLWCKGLARYLSLSVIAQTVVPNAIKMTGAGVVEKYGDGYKSAGSANVKSLERHYYERRKVALGRLTDYIESDESDCFDLSLLKTKAMACGCIKNCGCSNGANGGFNIIVPEYDCQSGFIGQPTNLYQVAPNKIDGSDTEIKGYATLEEAYAQPEKYFYMIRLNEEGDGEHDLKINPNGTINNINGKYV